MRSLGLFPFLSIRMRGGLFGGGWYELIGGGGGGGFARPQISRIGLTFRDPEQISIYLALLIPIFPALLISRGQWRRGFLTKISFGLLIDGSGDASLITGARSVKFPSLPSLSESSPSSHAP